MEASKNKLKKCNKGLHEFKATNYEVKKDNVYKREWFCMHCGINMNNR